VATAQPLSTKEELAALMQLTPDEDAAMDAAPGLFRVGITPTTSRSSIATTPRARCACR
jgi:hypothetical protein